MNCPACNAMRGQMKHERIIGVHWCQKCGAVYGTCYLGESYEIVLPYMADGSEIIPQERQVYYDFACLGSKGMTRRHGWFDIQTKLIVQVG